MTETLSSNNLADEAHKAYEQGEFANAARSYLAAAQSLDVSGDNVGAAELRNNASVSWLKAGKSKQAYQAAEGTPQIFAQNQDIRRQGIALGNLAAAAEALHRTEDAIDLYEQSIELLEAAGEKEYRAYALKALSALKLRSGKQVEALTMMDIGLDELPNPNFMQRLLKKLLSLRSFLLPR